MPVNKKDTNYFSQVLPEHPHRRLHVLLSILALVVVISSIYLYNSNKNIKEVVEESPPDEMSIQIEGLKLLNEKINRDVTLEEKIEGLKILNEKSKSLNK